MPFTPPAPVPPTPWPSSAADQKRLVEAVIEAAPMAMALLDPRGCVMLDNHAYKKLIADLAVPEPAHALLDSLLDDWRAHLAKQPERCAFASRETRIDRAGGRTRWLSVTSAAVALEPERSGLLLVIADVTGRHAEQERRRASELQAQLAEEERVAALREGLSAALFRLEEPMNVMASAIAVLQRRDPDRAALLDEALTASRQHLDTLRQAIPSGTPERLLGVNLNEVLRDVLSISTPRLLAAGIQVDWQPALTLPSLPGRPLQLRMLFKALIDNAIEAMDHRGWSRRALGLSTAATADRVRVVVRDTGPGMAPAWRLRAFEPFVSGKNGRGRHLGTGLSRAQQVVIDHGGIIDLDDNPGGGCAVSVEFRLDRDHESF